jgi:cell division protein FtsQ
MVRWAVALVTGAVFVAAGWVLHLAANPWRTPVAAVELEGELRYLSHQALAEVVVGPASQGFFRVDLREVRVALLRLPWVREARVRRVWPDRLRITVRERVPAARWAAGGLLDAEGELFHPSGPEPPAGLPVLEGPEGTHALVLSRYRELADWLAPSGWGIARAGMDARRAWWVDTDQGVRLVLGRKPSEAVVRRVAAVLPALAARTGEAPVRVDLRYPNGFAVQRRAPGGGPGEGREEHGQEER